MLLNKDNCGIAICNKNGRNALMHACMCALPEIVELLLSHSGCDPCQQDIDGCTPLMACIMVQENKAKIDRYVRVVQMLLNQDNCCIAICDKKGRNALMHACMNASPVIVDMLLNHGGCGPCQQDRDRHTSLFVSCIKSADEKVKNALNTCKKTSLV